MDHCLGGLVRSRQVLALSELAVAKVSMPSLVMVGNRNTRRIDLDASGLYPPRGYSELTASFADRATPPQSRSETSAEAKARSPAAAVATQRALAPIRK